MLKLKKNKKGFTLVELIVVVAIMAVLAGTVAGVVVSTQNKTKNSSADSSAQSIANDIKMGIIAGSIDLSATAGDTTLAKFLEAEYGSSVKSVDKKDIPTTDTDAIKAGKNVFQIYYDSDKNTITVYYVTVGTPKLSGYVVSNTNATPSVAQYK